jgi:hypothetical protein
MYTYGHNLPGCSPTEPFTAVHSFDEAKRALIFDLKFFEDHAASEDEAADLCHTAEDVNLWSGPGFVLAGGEAWEIQATDDDECSDDECNECHPYDDEDAWDDDEDVPDTCPQCGSTEHRSVLACDLLTAERLIR